MVRWYELTNALLWGTVNSSSCWAEIDDCKIREKARKIDGPHHGAGERWWWCEQVVSAAGFRAGFKYRSKRTDSGTGCHIREKGQM